jgi:hypothetical protein
MTIIRRSADSPSLPPRLGFDLQPTSAEAGVDLAISLALTSELQDDPARFVAEAVALLRELQAGNRFPQQGVELLERLTGQPRE